MPKVPTRGAKPCRMTAISHGREGRLDALYCSDIGLREDTARRESKSPNVRHHAWRQMMGRYDTNVDTYDEESLQSYREAVLQMVESAQALGVCPRIRSWRRKPPRNNLLTVIWTLSWSN